MKGFLEKAKNDPYANFLGVSIDKVERGYALCSVVIREEMLSFLGHVHGGFIFSLADVAFSAAANGDHLPSYALDVHGSFLKRTVVGDKIVAEATLINTTRMTGLYRMEIFKNQELIATFNGRVFKKL